MCRYTQSSNCGVTNDTEQWYVHQHRDGMMASFAEHWARLANTGVILIGCLMLSGPSGAVKSLDY